MAIKHLAIILDGNRRFAKRLMKKPWKGHEYGAQRVKNILEAIPKYKVKELTLYCLSVENLKKRPKKELDYLLNIFRQEFNGLEKGDEINKNKLKIRFIGSISLLPKDLQESCKRLELQTKNNKGIKLNFAMAYGGRQELIETVKKIVSKGIKEIDEKTISENLYLDSEPDLIIRTGGEKRTSNFLPWQAAYSEWIFLDKMWPEFNEEDLKNCIDEFESRKRNLGR